MTPAMFLTDPKAHEAIINNWRPTSIDTLFILTRSAKSYVLWGTVTLVKVTNLQDNWRSVRFTDHEEFLKKRKMPKLFQQRQLPVACFFDLEELSNGLSVDLEDMSNDFSVELEEISNELIFR